MQDIQLLFCIVSLFIGIASLSVSVFIYKLHKKKSLLLFIGLNASLFLIQSAISLNLYAAAGTHDFILILSHLMDILGTASSSLFGLFLVHSLLGRPVSPVQKTLFIAVSAIQFLGTAVCALFEDLIFLKSLVRVSYLLVIAYEVLFLCLHYRQIHSKELKKALKGFAIITVVFFPLFVLESFRSQIMSLRDVQLLKMLSLPAFFLIANFSFLSLALTYFNSPAFVEGGALTSYFVQKYNVTKKEVEVIELLMAGLTYSQISDQLFIAKKTVDNHVQNIYKKLEVTNKVQLLNLVRSKE